MAIIGSPIEQHWGGNEPPALTAGGGSATTPSEPEATERGTDAPQPAEVEADSSEISESGLAPAVDQTVELPAVAAWPTSRAVATRPPSERPLARRPIAFLAELARAMHAAAEAERVAVLERSRLDAHTFAELVQAQSTEEAAALKRHADEDVAGIREWSKAEIARIRAETEHRIDERRRELDAELEHHAAGVERQLERVRARIEAFEAEMSRFFEQLLAEEDPGRFAEMAARLPEPPSLDAPDGDEEAPAEAEVEAAGEAEVEVDTTLPAAPDEFEATGGPNATIAQTPHAPEPGPEPESSVEMQPFEAHGSTRSPFDEAEAAAAVDAAENEGIGILAEEVSDEASAAWAARLASLIGYGDTAPVDDARPTPPAPLEPRHETHSTQAIVIGLVSVASIAGFKRELAQLPGVSSVSVSSGPDGEFVFRVVHSDGLVLRDLIPSMPGFQARIVSTGPGVVNVSARDPEAES